MGCRTWASHTRVVGGKWSLLSIICPTEFSSRRGASVGLLFPWHQPWSLGLQEMAAGLGVPAVLSLPGKMPLWIFSLQFEQWKSQAVEWVSPFCSAYPFLEEWLQPVSQALGMLVATSSAREPAHPRPVKSGRLSWGGREGCWDNWSLLWFYSALLQKEKIAVTPPRGKMQPHGCWSGLLLQPAPVGFKLNLLSPGIGCFDSACMGL